MKYLIKVFQLSTTSFLSCPFTYGLALLFPQKKPNLSVSVFRPLNDITFERLSISISGSYTEKILLAYVKSELNVNLEFFY